MLKLNLSLTMLKRAIHSTKVAEEPAERASKKLPEVLVEVTFLSFLLTLWPLTSPVCLSTERTVNKDQMRLDLAEVQVDLFWFIQTSFLGKVTLSLTEAMDLMAVEVVDQEVESLSTTLTITCFQAIQSKVSNGLVIFTFTEDTQDQSTSNSWREHGERMEPQPTKSALEDFQDLFVSLVSQDIISMVLTMLFAPNVTISLMTPTMTLGDLTLLYALTLVLKIQTTLMSIQSACHSLNFKSRDLEASTFPLSSLWFTPSSVCLSGLALSRETKR